MSELVKQILRFTSPATKFFPHVCLSSVVIVSFVPYEVVVLPVLIFCWSYLAVLNVFTVLFLGQSLMRKPVNEIYGIILASVFSMTMSIFTFLATCWVVDNSVWVTFFGFTTKFGKGLTTVIAIGFLVTVLRMKRNLDMKFITYFFLLFAIITQVFDFTFSRYFHIQEDAIEIITTTDSVQKYFLEHEGIDFDDVDNMFVRNKSWENRSNPAMFTWYYRNVSQVGHVSLGLTIPATSQLYLSHWPLPDFTTNFLGKEKDYRPRESSSLLNDMDKEGGYPDHVIKFKLGILNENNILEWFQNHGEDEYHVFLQNCITIVNSALRVGGVLQPIIVPFPWLPIFSVNPSTYFHSEVVVMNLYVSGYPWLDWIYIAQLEIIWIMITLICVLIALAILEVTYYQFTDTNFELGNYSFLEPKLKFVGKLWNFFPSLSPLVMLSLMILILAKTYGYFSIVFNEMCNRYFCLFYLD